MTLDIGVWIARREANKTGWFGEAFLGAARMSGNIAMRNFNGNGPRISYSVGEDASEDQKSGQDLYMLRRNFHNGTGRYVQEDIEFDFFNGEFQNRVYIQHSGDYRTAITAWGHENRGYIGSSGGPRLDLREDGGMTVVQPFDKSDRYYVYIEKDTESPYLRQLLQESSVETPAQGSLDDPRSPRTDMGAYATTLVANSANGAYAQLDITDADPQTARTILAHTVWDIVRRTGFPEDAPDSVRPLLRELYDEAEADYQRSLSLKGAAPAPGSAPKPAGTVPGMP